MNEWIPISDLYCDGWGHYWIYDTNEGVIEAYWNSDHQYMSDRNGKKLFAVTHFKYYQVPDDPITEERRKKLKRLDLDY